MSSHVKLFKRALLINLLKNMKDAVSNPSLKQTISNVMDTVGHTAPEIIDLRWKRIYQMCVVHMGDVGNSEHAKCFELYTHALEEYKKLL